MRGSISSLIAGRALRSAPCFPRGKETGSFLPSVSRGNGGTFSKAKWYFAAQSTRTPKCFLRIAQRSVGQSRIPGFAIAFVLYRLFVCTGLHDYSAIAVSAKCCFADPLHAKSVLPSFLLEEEQLRSCFPKQGEAMVLFLSAGKGYVAFGVRAKVRS